jgi:hypothetical protein
MAMRKLMVGLVSIVACSSWSNVLGAQDRPAEPLSVRTGVAPAMPAGNKILVFENATDKSFDVLVQVDPRSKATCQVLVNNVEVAVLRLTGTVMGTVKPGGGDFSVTAIGKRGECRWTMLSIQGGAK